MKHNKIEKIETAVRIFFFFTFLVLFFCGNTGIIDTYESYALMPYVGGGALALGCVANLKYVMTSGFATFLALSIMTFIDLFALSMSIFIIGSIFEIEVTTSLLVVLPIAIIMLVIPHLHIRGANKQP